MKYIKENKMKKSVLVIFVTFFVLLLGAARTAQRYQLVTHQDIWRVAEACTSADAEATALAVGERTFQTVLAAIAAATDRSTGDGEIEWYITPDSWNSIRFTAIGITDNGTYTVDVFTGSLSSAVKSTDSLAEANAKLDDCNLTHIGTLAFVIGTQASTTSGYEMADAVTVTTKDATTSWTSASNAADDTAEAVIDIQGANVIIFVPTTCTANSKLLITGY